jgi:hypothetical protein
MGIVLQSCGYRMSSVTIDYGLAGGLEVQFLMS